MRAIRLILVLALATSLGACEALLGGDPTPDSIRYRILGTAGSEVQVIVSKQFLSGVREDGVTEVSIFGSDTLNTVLPVDGTLDISLERRFYIQAVPADTLAPLTGVRVVVDVDDRNLLDESGDIIPDPPFRFVYVFNELTTRIIEVF